MATVIRCKDVGFDCDGIIRAETEEEALQQAAQHAKEAHGLDEVTDEIIAQVQAAMRDA
jgi:predicted small metal-binding protein